MFNAPSEAAPASEDPLPSVVIDASALPTLPTEWPSDCRGDLDASTSYAVEFTSIDAWRHADVVAVVEVIAEAPGQRKVVAGGGGGVRARCDLKDRTCDSW